MDAASVAAEPSNLLTSSTPPIHPPSTELQGAGEVAGGGRGMTLDERAVLLSAAVTIDFDYFSRHSSMGHGGGVMPMMIPMGGGGGGGGGATTGGAVAGMGTGAPYDSQEKDGGSEYPPPETRNRDDPSQDPVMDDPWAENDQTQPWETTSHEASPTPGDAVDGDSSNPIEWFFND